MHVTNPLTLIPIFLLLNSTTALTTARVWTHFYPSCPGDPSTDSMATYETSEQSSPEIDIHAGSCQSVSTPSFARNDVDHISIDAEIFWAEPFDKCNITVHEVPECVDPPLVNKEIKDRVAVSECTKRNFAAFSQVWVKLDCEEVGTGKHYPKSPLLHGEQYHNGTAPRVGANTKTLPFRKLGGGRLARLIV